MDEALDVVDVVVILLCLPVDPGINTYNSASMSASVLLSILSLVRAFVGGGSLSLNSWFPLSSFVSSMFGFKGRGEVKGLLCL